LVKESRNPKVSVMIVTYNQEYLIRETIDSVLLQDYDNLEIVVADDASTDNTLNILQDYAAKFPEKFVLVLNEKNLGITGNCNSALKACSGELIAVLGGDDVFLPGKISAQVEIFIENPDVSLSYHAVEVFQHQTGRTLHITNQKPSDDILNIQDMLVKMGIPGGSSLMHRASAVPVGGYDSRLPMVSDWLFMLELAMHGKIAKLNGIYARYRKHGHGASDKTLELLGESIANIDIFMEKYPVRVDLILYCKRAKARYIAGEGFRQLGKKRDVAKNLFRRCIILDGENLSYRILYAISALPIISEFIGKILNFYKYRLK
jgi:glycosyltransferase involved in cell wall biosynthesis